MRTANRRKPMYACSQTFLQENRNFVQETIFRTKVPAIFTGVILETMTMESWSVLN